MVTQVADIIIYSLDDFYHQNTSVKSPLPLNAKLKIDQVLETFECFKENAAPLYNGFSNNYGKQDYSKHTLRMKNMHSSSLPPNILSKLKSTVGNDDERELLSNLNKLTFANYDNLIKKVVRKLDNKNILYVVKKIVDKCTHEPGYVELYVKALDKIISSYGQEAKSIVQTVINESRSNMYTSFKEITEHCQDSTDVSYDTFCAQQKLKTDIVGVNKLVIEAIHKNVYTAMDVDEVCIHLLEILLIYKSDNQILEIIAQMLYDFFRVEKNKNSIKKLESMLANELSDISNRAKFKILDILDLHKV